MESSAPAPIFMQASVGGYHGERMSTVFATLEPATDVLLVMKIAKNPTPTRYKPDTRVVTNLADMDSWDLFFTEDNLREAIAAFVERKSAGKFKFTGETASANPGAGVQLLKVTERGREYELPELRNEQLAGILLCWFAKVHNGITQNAEFGSLIEKLQRGEAWTV